MKVKYTGGHHSRKLIKSDLTRHGVDDQNAVTWDDSNNWVAEVTEAAGKWLIDNDSEFRKATKDDENTTDHSRTARNLPQSTVLSEDALPVNSSESPIIDGANTPPDALTDRS